MPGPSPATTVVRYSALIGGVLYGLVHAGTVQSKYEDDQAKAQIARRSHLVDEAKKAYAQKLVADKAGNATQLITNIDDPKFDLEKIIEAYTKTP
ncbi:ATP synthase E chain-domain-containing protein [Dioszegia hungarica]|uniref:ATP synthase F(0) complex subunit e, mitochondrial n=1 Tax=Dioszegia hungarica TaxID=4972 RepID=A0AA38LWR0_9TREE|nr:ATP synthase E chain-domain-containing protein [Dioszegia hungarica]KAI9638982.1 ATP synthase E chain-domain-containing protein [Dioszegia hungarica]